MKIFRPTDQLFLWTLLVNQLVWSNPPASITAQETTEQKLINMVNKAPIPLITFVIICWLCITESVHSLCRDGADAQYILFIEMNNDNYPPLALCTRAPEEKLKNDNIPANTLICRQKLARRIPCKIMFLSSTPLLLSIAARSTVQRRCRQIFATVMTVQRQKIFAKPHRPTS